MPDLIVIATILSIAAAGFGLARAHWHAGKLGHGCKTDRLLGGQEPD